MGELLTIEARVEMAMRNWVAWQNTATSFRLSLECSVTTRTHYVNEKEAEKVEKILLSLKRFNRDLYNALDIYYNHVDFETVVQMAGRLDICDDTLRSRRKRGEDFIAGYLA